LNHSVSPGLRELSKKSTVVSRVRILCCFVGVSRDRLGLLMIGPPGIIQFQQLFISCSSLRVSLRQSQGPGFLSGNNGIVETSGFGIGGGQGFE